MDAVDFGVSVLYEIDILKQVWSNTGVAINDIVTPGAELWNRLFQTGFRLCATPAACGITGLQVPTFWTGLQPGGRTSTDVCTLVTPWLETTSSADGSTGISSGSGDDFWSTDNGTPLGCDLSHSLMCVCVVQA